MKRASKMICTNDECLGTFYTFYGNGSRDLIMCPLCGHNCLKEKDKEYTIFDSELLIDALAPEAE